MVEPVKVPLSGGGLFALVDIEDAERVLAFKWRARRDRWVIDGVEHSNTYAERTCSATEPSRTESMHRFLSNCRIGDEKIVDHRNNNCLDNRRANLRVADHRRNQQNRSAERRLARGQFKGVSRHAGRWRARIRAGALGPNGRRAELYLGHFDAAETAARAYDAAAREHFGEFANCNFQITVAP